MRKSKPRLSLAERGRYLADARQLREAGVELRIPEDLLESGRAVDIVPVGGLASMVSESSNGGVHYAVWVRLVARYACALLHCRMNTKWDGDIVLNSYDDQAALCALGHLDYTQEEVLNQRIEKSLRFSHRGDMAEGFILATGVRPIPHAFRQGMLMPIELTFEDQFENEVWIEAELSVNWTAKPKRAAVRCGTGLYGAASSSRRVAVSGDLSGPQRQHAFSSYLDRMQGAPQHDARRANADAEM
jgi:hypothetical protein